jgi:hypothetical protein
MTLEAFATALFDHWGVGKAETNDGVMVLVFRDDRAMRLELGAAYGRDWDRVAQDVVERHFLNDFATGDYVRGMTWGTEQTIERIVLPFREGAAPQAGGGLRDWIIGIGMFGAVLLAMSRRWIGDLLARLRRCPQCGRRGLRQTRSVLTAATGALPGTGERLRTCPYCDFEERDSYHIPVRRASSRAASAAAVRRRRRVGTLVAASGDLGHRHGPLARRPGPRRIPEGPEERPAHRVLRRAVLGMPLHRQGEARRALDIDRLGRAIGRMSVDHDPLPGRLIPCPCSVLVITSVAPNSR